MPARRHNPSLFKCFFPLSDQCAPSDFLDKAQNHTAVKAFARLLSAAALPCAAPSLPLSESGSYFQQKKLNLRESKKQKHSRTVRSIASMVDWQKPGARKPPGRSLSPCPDFSGSSSYPKQRDPRKGAPFCCLGMIYVWASSKSRVAVSGRLMHGVAVVCG